jgi:hypothetical protein
VLGLHCASVAAVPWSQLCCDHSCIGVPAVPGLQLSVGSLPKLRVMDKSENERYSSVEEQFLAVVELANVSPTK